MEVNISSDRSWHFVSNIISYYITGYGAREFRRDIFFFVEIYIKSCLKSENSQACLAGT
jgi:hypothetical protein